MTSVFAYRKASLAIQIPEDWMNSDIMEIYGYPELGEDGATPISADVLVLRMSYLKHLQRARKWIRWIIRIPIISAFCI